MLCVIKFDNGLYWCGYNKADKQIRKARVYNSIKYAREAADDCITRKNYIVPYDIMPNVTNYKIVEIEIKEVGEVE